ncbi:MAG: aminotransferase class V-fold PLP-dependent enzyme, partial [Chthoniobacterales bacterium]
EYTPGPFRWLNGTPVIPALYACAEGVKVIKQAGVDAIREKSVRQTSKLIELAEARGYKVFAPRDSKVRGGTVAIDVPNGYEVAQVLLAREILVDYRIGAGIRVAPHFFNRDDEVETVVAAIDEAIETSAWQKYSGKAAVVT